MKAERPGCRTSGCSARMRRAPPDRAGARTRSASGRSRQRAGRSACAMNGWSVLCKPSSRPVGRRGDLRHQRARRARAARSAASSSRRHWPGSMSFCSRAKVTGRPVAAASCSIHASSRLLAASRSDASSKHAVAGVAERAADAEQLVLGAANVPGTGSPSIARCSSVRDVVKPSAPAAMPSRTIAAMRGDVVGGRRLVLRAALAHDVGAHRAVRHLRADVERARHRVERVEVLGEALPGPARCPRRARCRGCPRRPP